MKTKIALPECGVTTVVPAIITIWGLWQHFEIIFFALEQSLVRVQSASFSYQQWCLVTVKKGMMGCVVQTKKCKVLSEGSWEDDVIANICLFEDSDNDLISSDSGLHGQGKQRRVIKKTSLLTVIFMMMFWMLILLQVKHPLPYLLQQMVKLKPLWILLKKYNCSPVSYSWIFSALYNGPSNCSLTPSSVLCSVPSWSSRNQTLEVHTTFSILLRPYQEHW